MDELDPDDDTDDATEDANADAANVRPPVDPADIAIDGRGRSVKLLLRYAREAPDGARDLLERVLREGSFAMRLAAIRALAGRDPDAAEQYAIAELRERRGLESHKLAVVMLELHRQTATEAVLRLALEPGSTVALALDELRKHDLFRLVAAFVELASELDPASMARVGDVLHVDDLLLPSGRGGRLGHQLRERLAIALVDSPHVGDRIRDLAVAYLVENAGNEGTAALFRHVDHPAIPFSVRARASLAGDPRAAYEELVDVFRHQPETRGVIARALDHRADPRWVHEVLADVQHDPQGVATTLVRMRAADELCDLAARPELDELARWALHALGLIGDPRAAPLLMWWLDTPAGVERAPMLLSALAECGGAELIPELEARLSTAGPRAAFYRFAIDRIRTRTTTPS